MSSAIIPAASRPFSCLALTEGHVDALALAHDHLTGEEQAIALLAFARALNSFAKVQTWALQRSLKLAARAVN